jgi:hypothetical protein
MSRRDITNEDLFNFIEMMPQKVDEDEASATSEFVESLSLIEKCERLKEENERLMSEVNSLRKVVEAAEAAMLTHRKDCEIEFHGHTCDCGFDAFNEALKELEGRDERN